MDKLDTKPRGIAIKGTQSNNNFFFLKNFTILFFF